MDQLSPFHDSARVPAVVVPFDQPPTATQAELASKIRRSSGTGLPELPIGDRMP
jgi:hypothetical protein